MRLSRSVCPRPVTAATYIAVLAATCCFYSSATATENRRAIEPLPPLPERKPNTLRQQSNRFALPVLRRNVRIKPNRWLGRADEIATLYAIQTALSSVGDGGAYVWQRRNGLLDGLIRPTTSFKSSSGEICRHLIIRLNSKHYSREVEGIACRDGSGVWSLSG